MKHHPFEQFLAEYLPRIENKTKQVNLAYWILETTGSEDAATLKAELDTELRLLFHDVSLYRKLEQWDQDKALQDPLLKRQLNVLIRAFKQNQIPKELLEALAQKEAKLSQVYGQFRPNFEGKPLSENQIRELLKTKTDPAVRKKVWSASKEIGEVLAPRILELVSLRNQAANSLGYGDYFEMQLALQEVDRTALLRLLEDLAERSKPAYAEMLNVLEATLSARFQVTKESLGPWAWSEPFGQEDPLDSQGLDSLVEGVDLVDSCLAYYQKMGFAVGPILKRSDLFEHPGKNQHAFCINIDRLGDVRTLNNIKPTIKWLETVLHELGHAVYELGFDSSLPWLLREPPHMIPTEAMALLAGRQAYRKVSLQHLVGSKKSIYLNQAEESLKRRQLIFSRWVLVMTAFESELYRNPHQDLNRLWWDCVERYQMIRPPKGREGKADWAAKYHIGLAPVYYFSYLLGELFASSIQEVVQSKTGTEDLATHQAGVFLQERLFSPGNCWRWDKLIEHVTGAPLSPDAWLKEFASCR